MFIIALPPLQYSLSYHISPLGGGGRSKQKALAPNMGTDLDRLKEQDPAKDARIPGRAKAPSGSPEQPLKEPRNVAPSQRARSPRQPGHQRSQPQPDKLVGHPPEPQPDPRKGDHSAKVKHLHNISQTSPNAPGRPKASQLAKLASKRIQGTEERAPEPTKRAPQGGIPA